jgi:transposase InsO family protein
MEYLTERQRESHKKRVVKDSYKYGATETVRKYGISRDTVYRWRKTVKTKKRGPKNPVAWKTSASLERIVVRLRKQTLYGPKRLKHELELHGIKIGEKAIRGILERRKLVKKHRKKRKKTLQKFYAPYAGYRLQVDTKAVPDPGRDLRSPLRYQFTAIDIFTRIRFLLIYEELSNANSIDFIRQALAFYSEIGINIETVQTDNHGTFTNLYIGGNKKQDHEIVRPHPLSEFLISQGIHHILSRPGTPKDNTFVERSHRTDGEEFYRITDLKSLSNEELNLKIQLWCYHYNFLRIHSSCNYLPPFKFFLSVLQTGA